MLRSSSLTQVTKRRTGSYCSWRWSAVLQKETKGGNWKRQKCRFDFGCRYMC